jgi:hypothetical protein
MYHTQDEACHVDRQGGFQHMGSTQMKITLNLADRLQSANKICALDEESHQGHNLINS